MVQKFFDKLADNPLPVALAVGAVLLVCYLSVKAVVDWAFGLAFVQVLTWAMLATVAVPFVAAVAFWGGRHGQPGLVDEAYQRGDKAGFRRARLTNSETEMRLREESKDRGDAFLQGAESGLNLVGVMVKARGEARQPVLPQPMPPAAPTQIEWRTSDDVIDV